MESKGYGLFKFLSALQMDISDDFPSKSFTISLINAELSCYYPDIIRCDYITDHFSVHLTDLTVGAGEEEMINIHDDCCDWGGVY